MEILLSIKPEYSNLIFSGKKKYEFRKVLPKKRFSKIYLYESSPKRRVVGWIIVGKIISGTPDEVWLQCQSYSGLNRNHFYEYCNGNRMIYALKINKVHRYDDPINPYNFQTPFVAPQNFSYIDDNQEWYTLLNNG